MFLQVSVCSQGRGVWQRGVVGGMYGKGACVAEEVYGGKCMAGGVHGRGHVWQGACMVGGGMCVGELATEAVGMHPTGMHSCVMSKILFMLPQKF